MALPEEFGQHERTWDVKDTHSALVEVTFASCRFFMGDL